jgi:ABC-type uncharacterized transport system substrate-binding protein
MKRREFITLLGGAATAWPLAARAQQPAVMGLLSPGSFEQTRERIAAMHRGLAEAGYVEGRNLTIEYRWGGDRNDRLAELAADLVRRRVAVIQANSAPSVRAVRAATQNIPIVFTLGTDPVESGFVASFNRPGGNITGNGARGAKCCAMIRFSIDPISVCTAWTPGAGRWRRSPAAFARYGQKSANARIAAVFCWASV